ncbi:MAG: UDP-N-acetylmuramate dehydrogenase [Thermodesulfovibrionales bacterium]
MMGASPDIRENYPLKELTTFRIGGPARFFAAVATEEQAQEALAFSREAGVPVFVLGGGSNILVSDAGFPGLVILNRIQGREVRREGEEVLVRAGAGEEWDALVRHCVENSWQGVECLSGIPGTAGAAPVQNIGAYGQSAGAVVAEVRTLRVESGERVVFNNPECGFGYRTSFFNAAGAGKYLITSVLFRLIRGGAPDLSYRDLQKHFSGRGEVSLAQVREAVLEIRNAKGLLTLEGYDVFRSAGSFFRNPLIPGGQFEELRRQVQDAGGCTAWAWPQPSGEVKVSAACLIQCAGFPRGHRQGRVGLSPRHALILVNYQDASSGEVVAFAREVQERVKERFGVLLKPEVQLVGFSPPHPLL